jgi:polygalacturonase
MKSIEFLTYTALAVGMMATPLLGSDLRPFMEFEGRWDSAESAAETGLFLPFLLESGDAAFVDLDAAVFDGAMQRGSSGVGYRSRFGSNAVVGAYAYYDYLHTELNNNFHQLSFGAEVLWPIFETRANVYVPLGGGHKAGGFGAGFISGDGFVFREGMERARPGIDAEVGAKVPGISDGTNAQLKVYAGGYWYGGTNLDDVFGARLRAELTFADLPSLPVGSTASLGVAGTYDNEDRFGGSVMARLRIPLNSNSADASDPFDPYTSRVERQGLIKTHLGATGDAEKAVAELNGQTISRVLRVSAASGDATAINTLLASAGSGALLLADGDLGLANSLVLGNGQILVGGGGMLILRGAISGERGTFANRGASTTLTGYDPTQDVVTLASNSAIAGLSIRGGLAGIGSVDTTNLSISNVDISATAHDGIRLTRVGGATIADTKIHDLYVCENSTQCEFSVFDPNTAPYAAISAHGTNNLTVRDTVIDTVTYGIFAGSEIDDSGYPVVITNLASNITLENVVISKSRREGLLFVAADQVKIDRVTVDNSEQGRDMDLVVLQGTSNVTITDTTLKGGINGLMLVTASSMPDESKTTNVRIDGLKIDSTRNAGIFVNPVSGIDFKNVAITNAGTYGMFLYGSDYAFLGGPISDVSFENVRIDNAAQSGLYFLGPSVDLSGNISVTASPRDCKVDVYSSTLLGGSLTQSHGSVLTINGTALDASNLRQRCG